MRFYDRLGWPLPDCAPPPLVPEDPVQELIRRNRERDIDPDGWTCTSQFKRGADIPWGVEAQVREALDR